MASSSEYNWQAEKTITECNLHMLTSEDCSDVIFRLGSEKQVVRAHRYVLVSRSCVFYAMFYGPLAEKGVVTIPDIEPDVFRGFLRYLYTDRINITFENVSGLMQTSNKYLVGSLFKQSLAFLEESLSEETVCQILELCHVYQLKDLELKALKILTEAGEKVIKSSGTPKLCSDYFWKFLKSEELNLKEEDIFTGALSWAEEQCQRQKINVTPENLRQVLGKMIYEVRFSSMSQDYLENLVYTSGILTRDERIDIAPFKAQARERSVRQNVVCRFGKVSFGWTLSPNEEAISFSTNKNILLLGCQMYGPSHHEKSTYSLNIRLYDKQETLFAEPVPASKRELKGSKNAKLSVNEILFPDPVQISADRIYTLWVSMIGDYTDFGEGGKPSVEVDGVEFTFMNSSMSLPTAERTGTTTWEGQIPGLLWR